MSIKPTKEQENELRYIRAMVEQYGKESITEAEYMLLTWYMCNLEWDDYCRITANVIRK